MAFQGTKVISYWDNSMAQLANIEFMELSFVIKTEGDCLLDDMNNLPEQVMSHLLDGKDKCNHLEGGE